MHAEKTTEFSVYLDQRPGELAGLLDACQASGVEIVSLVCGEHNDRAVVRLIGAPVESLRRVCESLVESGHGPVVEAEVFALEVHNRIGMVRDIATHMARSGVNVRYCYLCPANGSGGTRCVFRFDDPAAASRALDTLDLPQRPSSRGAGDASRESPGSLGSGGTSAA